MNLQLKQIKRHNLKTKVELEYLERLKGSSDVIRQPLLHQTHPHPGSSLIVNIRLLIVDREYLADAHYYSHMS